MNEIRSLKEGFGKRKILVKTIIILSLVALSLSIISTPAFARTVSLLTNSVSIIPGSNASGGTAIFLDGTTQVWSRAITGGKVTPGDAFTIANDTSAGTFYLVLTAPDSGAPDGPKNRTNTPDASYTAMGEPVDFPVNTWLSTIIDAPPPVTGTATQTGFNLQMEPVISVSLQIPAVAPFVGYYAPGYYPVGGYHYKVVDASNMTVMEEGNKGGASFDLDPTKYPVAQKNYILTAYAYNGYTTGHGDTNNPRWSVNILFSTTGGGAGVLTSNLYLNSMLNFFSLGIPSSEATKAWYVGTTPFSTVGEFINDVLGTTNVSTFGYVDYSGNMVGVRNTTSGLTGNLDLNEKMSSTKGYQVYLRQTLPPITIRNASQ